MASLYEEEKIAASLGDNERMLVASITSFTARPRHHSPATRSAFNKDTSTAERLAVDMSTATVAL